MPAEIAQHRPGRVEPAKRIGVADREACGQQAALVEQILVAHGDHAAPGALRVGELHGRPGQRLFRHLVRRARRVRIQHQHAQPVAERGHKAQRRIVPRQRLPEAERRIDLRELCRRYALHPLIPVARKAGGAAVVQVVVAGQDQHGDARIRDPLQLLRQRLMAFARSVERQVARKDERVGPACDHLSDERLGELLAVVHDLAVPAPDQLLKERPVISQLRREEMQIRRHHDGHPAARPAQAHGRRQQQQRQQPHHPSFHSVRLLQPFQSSGFHYSAKPAAAKGRIRQTRRRNPSRKAGSARSHFRTA